MSTSTDKLKLMLNKEQLTYVLKLFGGKDSSSTAVFIIYYFISFVIGTLAGTDLAWLILILNSIMGIILTIAQNRNNGEKGNLKTVAIEKDKQIDILKQDHQRELSNMADGYTRAIDRMQFILEMIQSAFKDKLSIEPIMRLIEAQLVQPGSVTPPIVEKPIPVVKPPEPVKEPKIIKEPEQIFEKTEPVQTFELDNQEIIKNL